ncbi:restriction endonuclease subunit S [Streptomyces sp. ME19-01-6]|uniref:restriction endonuclease subunit S n=1 Tax=Streptomyces sp. ME19-01-6 TaxID=3028686 RepID=UPI0029B95CF7|nr:restriction endonuclease subunit S [Streptomyces sp. ME19-01-6]MDX3231068.1 restriction endonuclease subunit S [Streptomyces sp. ME19-01-6]
MPVELALDWPTRKFTEIVRLPVGQVDPRKQPYRDQVLLAPDHVESGTGRIIKRESAESQGASSGKYVVRPGDVVLSKIRPALRKVVLADFAGTCSADMYPMQPTEDVLAEFICTILLSEEFSQYAENMSGRTGIPKINRSDLAGFSVRVPPLNEQRQIAEVLNAFADSERLIEASIAKSQVMLSAFTQSAFPSGDTLPYVPLGSVASVSGGVTLGRDIPEGTSVELPYLRVANVQDGYFDCTEMKHVRILQSEIYRYSLETGDLVLTEGGDFDKLGRGAVWDGRISPCLHQNHLFRIRCERQINPHYLALYTSSTQGRAYFLSVAKQTTNLATINSSQVKSMPVPCPSLEEQNKIVATARIIEDQIHASQAEQEKLHTLKQGMADALLTGKVRFRDIA